nr:MAG TPA: hypothetical protein [Crassvirales sp.]
MKKYIIKYANGSTCPDIKGEFNSREEAGDFLMRYICIHNELLHTGDNNYLLPFDFILEKVDVKNVNEVITDFKSARKALGLKPNTCYNLSEHVPKFVSDINPKHIEALIALNELFTIAEAWNKEDGFVPDFSDREQDITRLYSDMCISVLGFALKHLNVPHNLVNNLKSFIIRFSCD